MRLNRMLSFIPNKVTIILSINEIIIYRGTVNDANKFSNLYEVIQINPVDNELFITVC